MRAGRNLIQACLLCAALLQAADSGAQPVTNIAAGGYHNLFLKGNGSLWAMGYNGSGELGDGTFNSTNLPEQILASNVTAIAAGQYHSFFLKTNGSLWAMGYNGDGELGDGTYSANDPYDGTNQPERIVATNVMAVAAGGYHSLFLKRDGSLWVMGYNSSGELGDGTFNSTNLPEQIVASNVTAVAGGLFHSLFLKNDGSLWGMGYNGDGELGDGTYSANDPYYGTNLPEQIVASNVTAIAAGGYFSLFLKTDGSLWAMGFNGFGELGDGSFNNTNLPEQVVASNVVAVAAGGGYYSEGNTTFYTDHSLFLKRDGSLWGMGDNSFGQLGDETIKDVNQPDEIVASNVAAIAAGELHSLFLKNDGSLWGMGYNGDGELGDGTFNAVFSPEQILAPYNRISGLLLTNGNIRLSFVGIAGANYALDRATRLSPANWMPQTTNPAGSFGPLVFTNAPASGTDNFWRIRSVP